MYLNRVRQALHYLYSSIDRLNELLKYQHDLTKEEQTELQDFMNEIINLSGRVAVFILERGEDLGW